MQTFTVGTILMLALLAATGSAQAQNVKITSLGSHAGELCNRDRATILEDPSGVRILYDAGQSVTGADDLRLGRIDVVLLTHAHGDHIGDMKLKALEAGSCDNPQVVSAAPNSTTAEIAAAKNAALIMEIQLGAFIARKIEAIRGKPTPACGPPDADLVPPFAAPCLATVRTGGSRIVKASAASKGVEIATVPAVHDSAVSLALVSEAQRKAMEPDGASYELGPPIGYVVRFTNGLVAYLTGDTGIHSDMQTVVRDYYKANLVELNLGPLAIDPESAAYAVNTLIQPASIIVTHVNEGATAGGTLRPSSRTAAFIARVKGRAVYPALSGKTMEFDGNGKCVAGC
jgi:L-ascorbate metabolism protein UlaG (beta-lactamase superfamily)